MTHVLFGDCRGRFHISVLKSNGWGRMFASQNPTCFDGEQWGFDNGAFDAYTNGEPFPEQLFLRRLAQAYGLFKFGLIPRPYLAVVPDMVACGCSSLQFSLNWMKRLAETGDILDEWPWYLAVQDDMTIHDVKPYVHHFDGIFLGGTDKFKAQGWKWCSFAHDNQKNFHYGRAGTLPKLESALKMKADSLDSNFPLWEKARTKQFVRQYHYWKENPRPVLAFGETFDKHTDGGQGPVQATLNENET